MRTYITVDGGTTNTRLHLVRDGAVIDTVKRSVGAGIHDPERLAREAGAAKEELLLRNGTREEDVSCILLSGMITSEYGLFPLAHLAAPAGIAELHKGMRQVSLPGFSSRPCFFIPGVKIQGDTLLDTDMMRGEETELVGLMEEKRGACAYLLPGSHSKLIFTDDGGRIVRFSTMMTGEIAAALSAHTILSDAVKLVGTSLEEGALLEGFEAVRTRGISEALFKVRVLKSLCGYGENACYSFYIGAVLSSEMERVLQSGAKRIVIGGQRSLRLASAAILRAYGNAEIVVLSDEEVKDSVARGAVRIYEWTE